VVKRAASLIAALLAVVINVGLLGLFGWAAFNPRGIYGPVREQVDFMALLFAVFPLANLVALGLQATASPSRGRYVRAVRVLNMALVVVAVTFGVASARESTFSSLEQVATLFLLVPPATTALALHSPKAITMEER
jgi:hypothetical protein